MNGPVPTERDTPAPPAPEASEGSAASAQAGRGACAQTGPAGAIPHVRAATPDDLPAAVAAVADLLIELGSTPPPAPAMLEAAHTLLDDPRTGALLVAQADETLVGVLGASYQTALHVPGRYVLIQDLWVSPAWRGQAVGRELLAALFALARGQGMTRTEVGLPRERFQGIRATEAFYLHNGFAPLGARMRRIFS
jgi:GNAT superfamily N-acetyltransferase